MRPDISSGPLDLVGSIARIRDKSSPSSMFTMLRRKRRRNTGIGDEFALLRKIHFILQSITKL